MTDPGSGTAWMQVPGGVRLRVRLVPKSSRDAIEGLEPSAEGPAVKARVRAVPEDGKANAAIEKLVADWVGVPKSQVGVTGGHKSRIKSLTISGDARVLAERIGRLVGTGDGSTGKG